MSQSVTDGTPVGPTTPQVPTGPAVPTGPTTRQAVKKSGFLKIDVPGAGVVRTLKDDETRTKDNHPRERSDLRPRDRKLEAWCRERPKDNKPKEDTQKSGGGSGSRFFPWKGTKGARC